MFENEYGINYIANIINFTQGQAYRRSTDPNKASELVGEIEMNSVSFRYHKDQPLVLNDVSFKISRGEMVAFVGTSGSGKSTIMRLLLGFEEPENGSIYYDGDAFDAMNVGEAECFKMER